MNRKELKGSPLTGSTNTGRPRDPATPTDSVEAWCRFHGIPFKGSEAPPAADADERG